MFSKYCTCKYVFQLQHKNLPTVFFFFLWKQNWQTWGLLPLFFLVYSRLLPGRFCGRLHKLLNVTRNQSSAANDDLHTVAVSRSPNDVEKTQVGGIVKVYLIKGLVTGGISCLPFARQITSFVAQSHCSCFCPQYEERSFFFAPPPTPLTDNTIAPQQNTSGSN